MALSSAFSIQVPCTGTGRIEANTAVRRSVVETTGKFLKKKHTLE